MINKKWFIGICILMFVLTLASFVVARPNSQRLDAGLSLQTIERNKHTLNNEYYLHTHIYDTEFGYLIEPNNKTVCNYHMYSENTDWQHLITDGSMTGYGSGYYDNINKSYFNNTGDYVILLWCENERDNSIEGGFVEFSFNVYDEASLETMESSYLLLLILIVFGVIAFGKIINVNIISMLGSLALLMLSLFLFSISTMIAVLVLFTALIMTLYFAIKEY